MCTVRLFSHGSRPLCTQILPRQGRPPSNILGIRSRDTGLSDGEERIPLLSLVLTQYRSVAGQTDRRTDEYAVAYTVFAASCKKRI